MGDAAIAPVAQAVMAPDPVRDRPEPSSATNSSKRKWSPCTWRYAIEEGQPELGSKPRRESCILPAAPGHRERDRERASSMSEPQRRPASPDKPEGPQTGADPIAANQSPNRQSMEKIGTHRRQGQAQRDGEEGEDAGKRSSIYKKPVPREEESLDERVRRKKKKEAMRKRAEREAGGHTEEGAWRKKREMTPSELYFCDVCSGRASPGAGASPCGGGCA